LKYVVAAETNLDWICSCTKKKRDMEKVLLQQGRNNKREGKREKWRLERGDSSPQTNERVKPLASWFVSLSRT